MLLCTSFLFTMVPLQAFMCILVVIGATTTNAFTTAPIHHHHQRRTLSSPLYQSGPDKGGGAAIATPKTKQATTTIQKQKLKNEQKQKAKPSDPDDQLGDFEDALYCWRTQAGQWPDRNAGIVLASGDGALGVRLGLPREYFQGGLDPQVAAAVRAAHELGRVVVRRRDRHARAHGDDHLEPIEFERTTGRLDAGA